MDPHLKDPYAPDVPGVPDSQTEDDSYLPDLECAVCFSQFNNVFNTPKMLECKHTFCLECLARMNVKSMQPESIQCPLCRAYTHLPAMGLPKLATDPKVLSYLPDAMQRVYSIRFSRDRGKLQVKRVPSSMPPCAAEVRHSMDLGMPAEADDPDRRSERQSICTRLARMPLCRALFMASGVLIMVSLTIGIVIILSNKK
ncbi:RING finger protein 223-like [Astyanax mexicanus]|uniref:RING finger protein 223-like n=1 Tax=Astyanax mexicanus TaxID=7994 RepID=A0A8T2KR15_ASTMX|nr:RING finger protein 223-like [Astyanax mexicanus]